ncbi:MAG: ABC transporter substrate-binding protein [Candidatus Tokpelaia sp.]|uniref:transporter substrate-binding domain-containing protein n=1 Tax=Candidatus Tokpelaia sp. TaxID=2233777 RepID=UPI00123893F5|nr:transporter substrate-binding domain-containing protein [Candidatus Tokpelaia sp.]KAA6206414.1 MAG: ABC transporter substrate-binding protein [Candidatus Tokpelaia sp.]KAA6207177.1 MAG: ABC transporter substrate-binding protein [Candidatus Tokpelaia sp.]
MRWNSGEVCFLKKAVTAALILGAAFMAVFCAQAARAENVLKVGGDCTYPPFTYKDSSGRLQGFDIDIAEEIARRLNMTMQHQCVAWDGLIPGLMVGKYDVIIAAMDITPERARRVDFSLPYYRAPSAFVGLKSAAKAPLDSTGRLAADFVAGKAVGVLRASIYEKYLQKTYPGVNLTRYGTIDDALMDLKAGRIDLVFTDMPKVEADFLHKTDNKDFAFIGPKIEDYAVLGEGSAVVLRKGNTALRDQVNMAVKAMMRDGTYDKINRKYWSFSVKP